MKFSGARLVALIVLAGVASVVWATLDENRSWRQKTVLEVETPSGLVSGGSVAEVSVSWFGGLNKLMSSSAVSSSVRGEASFVEVAPGKFLFALSLDDAPSRATDLFRVTPDEDQRKTTAMLETIRETRTLPPDLYPRLVKFGDVNDPKSVKLVDPNDLAATFGPGFALKGIRLEITDEKVSEGGMVKVLRWIGDYYDQRLDGNRYGDSAAEHSFANSLSAGTFDTEGNQK